MRRGFSAVGSQLATFSKSVVTGISEISTQVQEAVQMEMETKKQVLCPRSLARSLDR